MGKYDDLQTNRIIYVKLPWMSRHAESIKQIQKQIRSTQTSPDEVFSPNASALRPPESRI